MKQNYMKYGIKTFWLDEAEPERCVVRDSKSGHQLLCHPLTGVPCLRLGPRRHTQDIGTRYGCVVERDGQQRARGEAARCSKQRSRQQGEEGVIED